VIRGRFVLRATIDSDRRMENPWDVATQSKGLREGKTLQHANADCCRLSI